LLADSFDDKLGIVLVNSRFLLAASLVALHLLGGFVAPAAEPKRVLVVHSFVNAAPPFTTHSIAFESTLTAEMGERVDLDEISLDVARYATPDMLEALVEYLGKRQQGWRPDLVVPVGSPAGVFVAENRDRLFPSTPIIYTGMDRRRLPPGALERDATFVGESFDFPAMLEDMLQIAPATTNIAVVIGASQLEQYWTAAIQREWAPFTNRVGFTWLDHLPFDSMLKQVSQLPPRSFIFLVLLMRDASGVTHNADEALHRIRAIANAPVNGIFQHQLGLGIVGGRLYQAELEGSESARIAIRILRGEPATNFPPTIIGPLEPRYDWRELQRWHIDQARLPPGSTVMFREPTSWERNRARIIATSSIGIAQAASIFLLLANLARRRRAERSLRESRNRLQGILDTAVEGIITFDQHGRIESVNAAAGKLFGYPTSELVGQNVCLLVPSALREELDRHPGNPRETGGRKVFGIGREMKGRRKDGSEFPLELEVSEIQLVGRRILTGFARDITERKHAENIAREFGGRLLQAQEAERARLARELHDDITQRLARLAIDAGQIESGRDGAGRSGTAREVRDGLVRLGEDVHSLSYRLHPALLEDLGLPDALRAECDRFSRQEAIPVELKIEGDSKRIPKDTGLCLFRVTQEALRNVIRHSRARAAVVSLRPLEGGWQLAVTDSGVGFDLSLQRQRPSLGLASMRERVRLAGGELDIESAPGHGTTVVAWVPLKAEIR